MWCAGDTIHLVSVVNNDRAMPVSVGSTGKGGRTVTASLDDEYGFDKTLVRFPSRRATCLLQHLLLDCRVDRMMVLSYVCSRRTSKIVCMSLSDRGCFCMQEYGERLADKMLKTILTRFAPVLKDAGFDAQCYVNTVHGHKSAADIAESLVSSAIEAGADMLAVTSHGGCV